jgi:hypothetical protein
MAALEAAIQRLSGAQTRADWVAGSSPAMTN